MIAAGCLFVVLFPLLGFVTGQFLAGTAGAWWGAGIGLVLALAVLAVSGWALVRASRQG